jgi:hypothetical protein
MRAAQRSRGEKRVVTEFPDPACRARPRRDVEHPRGDVPKRNGRAVMARFRRLRDEEVVRTASPPPHRPGGGTRCYGPAAYQRVTDQRGVAPKA